MSDVLREASETAARERGRLEAGGLVRRALVKVRFLGTEDAARSGLRYQPVAWLAIAVAAVAFWFPGRPAPRTAAITLPPTPFTAANTPPTTTPSPIAPPTTLPAPVTFTSPPVTSFTPPTATTTTTTTPEPVALAVRGFGWASSLSGVPNNGVPDGTMPIANRLGNLDKASFVRLSGTATSLTLREDTSGAREAIGTGKVVACRITDASWEEKPDQALADAPAWDAKDCAPGTESDNTWTFDLARFADRAGEAGLALVPAADAPADFQVTFAT